MANKTVKHPNDSSLTYTYGQRGRKPMWVTELEKKKERAAKKHTATLTKKKKVKKKDSQKVQEGPKKFKSSFQINFEAEAFPYETQADIDDYVERSIKNSLDLYGFDPKNYTVSLIDS